MYYFVDSSEVEKANLPRFARMALRSDMTLASKAEAIALMLLLTSGHI